MLLGEVGRFLKVAFDDEKEIERLVVSNLELLFGAYAIFLPKHKVSTLGGVGTIPDGVVIDLQSKEWYLVEVERAAHGTWDHIAPQVSKQLTALIREENKERLLAIAIEEVSASQPLKDALRELEIREINLHREIAGILKKPPRIAIPIDDIPSDLVDWTSTLRNQVSVWQIEKFAKLGGSEILYSIPDEAVQSISASGTISISEARISGGELLRRVIRAGLLSVGQELYMEYGPRGRPKQRFMAIVQEDGLEVDGKVYSPSYAAVVCIRKAGSDRQTANGWLHWKTAEGVLIEALYRKLPEAEKPQSS